MVELFIYWRVLDTRLSDALVATAAFQREQRSQHAGLRTGLYRRGGGDRQTTLMETYAMLPAGIDVALQTALTEGGAQALQRWVHGERHLEAFEVVEVLAKQLD